MAGLPAGYLVKQLHDYADGRRRHAEMQAIARKLSPEARSRVADWYAALPASGGAGAEDIAALGADLYHRGAPDRGLKPCSACHGAQGQGRGAANPPLAGQSAAYLAEQLKLWRSGKRQNDPERVMLAFGRRLTLVEIEAVSAYAASLTGTAGVPGTASSRPAHRPDP